MATKTRKSPRKDIPKKKCQGECGKEKSYTFFYKVNSPMFPDGMINICRDCVRKQVDIDDMESVIGFLRQIDKPFIQSYWDEALKTDRYPLGEYVRKVNSLHQVKNKDFDATTDGDYGTTRDIQAQSFPDTIVTEEGNEIKYSESLIATWGVGYKKHEYIQLEAFYQDMTATYEVHTANHKQMLKQLAKLQLEMDKLLNIKDYTNYKVIAKAYDDLLKQSGFSPKDRKNGAEATGLSSFSQVWAEIEREGFIEPKMIDYPQDDVDHMLLYYIQFAQRLSGKSVSVEPPRDWRSQVDDMVIDGEFVSVEGVDEDGE